MTWALPFPSPGGFSGRILAGIHAALFGREHVRVHSCGAVADFHRASRTFRCGQGFWVAQLPGERPAAGQVREIQVVSDPVDDVKSKIALRLPVCSICYARPKSFRILRASNSSKIKEARHRVSREHEMGGNIPADWVTARRFRAGTCEFAAALATHAFNIPVSDATFEPAMSSAEMRRRS